MSRTCLSVNYGPGERIGENFLPVFPRKMTPASASACSGPDVGECYLSSCLLLQQQLTDQHHVSGAEADRGRGRRSAASELWVRSTHFICEAISLQMANSFRFCLRMPLPTTDEALLNYFKHLSPLFFSLTLWGLQFVE